MLLHPTTLATPDSPSFSAYRDLSSQHSWVRNQPFFLLQHPNIRNAGLPQRNRDRLLASGVIVFLETDLFQRFPVQLQGWDATTARSFTVDPIAKHFWVQDKLWWRRLLLSSLSPSSPTLSYCWPTEWLKNHLPTISPTLTSTILQLFILLKLKFFNMSLIYFVERVAYPCDISNQLLV